MVHDGKAHVMHITVRFSAVLVLAGMLSACAGGISNVLTPKDPVNRLLITGPVGESTKAESNVLLRPRGLQDGPVKQGNNPKREETENRPLGKTLNVPGGRSQQSLPVPE